MKKIKAMWRIIFARQWFVLTTTDKNRLSAFFNVTRSGMSVADLYFLRAWCDEMIDKSIIPPTKTFDKNV